MIIKLETKEGLKEFEGEINLLTYDIYFSTFGSDLLIDASRSIEVTGMYSRAYLLRVMYAMIKTKDALFIEFIPFLETLEDDVVSFFELLDNELVDLITSKLTERVDKELKQNDKITN